MPHLQITCAIFLIIATACTKNTVPPSQVNSPAADITTLERHAETTRLNDWFEIKFNQAVTRKPETATFLGLRQNYGKWNDPSDQAAKTEIEIQRANLAEMQETFNFNALTEQGKLSWRLAEFELQQAERAYKWRSHTYAFNQMFGVQSRIPAFLIAQHKIASKFDAQAYIERLKGVEAYLNVHISNAQTAGAKGVRPPYFVFDYVLSDSRNMLSGYPFENTDPANPAPLYADISTKIDALRTNTLITEQDAEALKLQARAALLEHFAPAYTGLIAFLEEEQSRATTDDGAWKLPQGTTYYKDRLIQITTTQMSADEIHQLGLAEIIRIHGEMRTIMATVGFTGNLQDFFALTRTGAQFFKPNTAQGKAEYLAEATDLIEAMKQALPNVFNTFPKAGLDVRAVESFREKSAGKAFYERPAPDGSRPGIYYANLYNMADMPTYQMEALAYHEGIPGHHMQLAISQELTGLPKFRKYGSYTAYTEGWGLYSEFLPKEMGFYSDPYSDFGRLAMELWRAARLVVDTGLHDKQWTRQTAIDYLMTNTPNPKGDCIKAIERYIVMPGQATAYKIGMLKILQLREAAKTKLGNAFDIRNFHDIVLKNGPVPLAILEENVKSWVASQTEN